MIDFDFVILLWMLLSLIGVFTTIYTKKVYTIVTISFICLAFLLIIPISFSIANPPGTIEKEPYHVEELEDVRLEITIDKDEGGYVDCYVKGENGFVLVKKIKRENVTFMWGEASSKVEWYHVTKTWGPFIMGSTETICYVKMAGDLNGETQTV